MLLQKTHLLESNTTLRAAKNHDEDLISLVQVTLPILLV